MLPARVGGRLIEGPSVQFQESLTFVRNRFYPAFSGLNVARDAQTRKASVWVLERAVHERTR